jgi:hypothetical protein
MIRRQLQARFHWLIDRDRAIAFAALRFFLSWILTK